MTRFSVLLTLAIVLCVTVGCTRIFVGKIAEPDYTATNVAGNIEIRDYSPTIIAETIVEGTRKDAANQGFRRLADYIFGNNISQTKIAVTAPVVQQSSEKIAMTAPVLQQKAAGDSWVVQFVMPKEYTLETLPQPVKNNVVLKAVPAKRYAVVRFSGRSSKENLEEHKEILARYVQEKALKPLGTPQFAFYDPPWTLWFLRRNEVRQEITGL